MIERHGWIETTMIRREKPRGWMAIHNVLIYYFQTPSILSKYRNDTLLIRNHVWLWLKSLLKNQCQFYIGYLYELFFFFNYCSIFREQRFLYFSNLIFVNQKKKMLLLMCRCILNETCISATKIFFKEKKEFLTISLSSSILKFKFLRDADAFKNLKFPEYLLL